MNLADITTKCYILALIIRDDGERLLLGDGAYEFKDSQQHFIANTYANDVVELQGTDGQMLAGQVRRTATQTFAGYIGDATFSKQRIEAARRDFLMFFRKKHYYTAVYVFSDGTAIQRDRGYIVNAPSVPELYQRFPEWSVGLNFEDPNYYEYAEDDLGHEIAAHKVELELSTAMSGGLIWDGDGAVSDDLSYVGTEIPGEGKNFQLADTGTATLKSAELLGDAEQTTYSGKNKMPMASADMTEERQASFSMSLPAGDYTVSFNLDSFTLGTNTSFSLAMSINGAGGSQIVDVRLLALTSSTSLGQYSVAFTLPADGTTDAPDNIRIGLTYWNNGARAKLSNIQIESGSTATAYEPYVGGTASPNPDYPQAVNVVTGENTVKIEGKNLCPDTSEGYWVGSGGTNAGRTANDSGVAIPVQPNTYYAVSTTTTQARYRCAWSDSTTTIGGASLTTASFFSADNTSGSHTGSSGSHKYLIINATDLSAIQIELGSTATTYEPYQGQTRPVNLGKNLLGLQNTSTMQQNGVTISVQDGTISLNGTASVSFGVNVANLAEDLRLTNGIDYAISMKTISGSASRNFDVQLRDASDTNIFSVNSDYFPVSRNTLSGVGKKLRLYFAYGTVLTNYKIAFQIELGTQATSYSAYFTPIELAKIGNYQDRIYKQDGKWYIEKQTGKVVLDGSENWQLGSMFYCTSPIYSAMQSIMPTNGNIKSDYFTYSGGATNDPSIDIVNGYIIRIKDTSKASVSDLTTWLASHPTTLYYALATPTTTEITNSELVGQLERLQHAHTYADTTNFSITATSPNLPAYLKVVAFSDDAIPQGGYVWEDGGTGGATTITVDGVDNAQPIWTVVGPATNPSLTNITTGESIQWTGVVPNGQTLVVNMADMTASLSGANVFEFISGSWITLQAGNNRVSYSATAATGIATLEWNGVVG